MPPCAGITAVESGYLADNVVRTTFPVRVIGVIGTVSGPILGTAVIQLLEQWLESAMLRDALPTWLRTDLLFGLVYIALVVFFPAGLVGAF